MSPLFTYKGKLLQQNGKLAANEQCCCGETGSYCCYCAGPSYGYNANNIALNTKLFCGTQAPPQGWDCVVTWRNPDTGQVLSLPRENPPPGGFVFINMLCDTGFFRCRVVQALVNDDFGFGGLNGIQDQLPGTTDWVESLGPLHACLENISKEECEQCRELVAGDMETFNDLCGTFTLKKDKPNSQCCFPFPQYNAADGQNCICSNDINVLP